MGQCVGRFVFSESECPPTTVVLEPDGTLKDPHQYASVVETDQVFRIQFPFAGQYARKKPDGSLYRFIDLHAFTQSNDGSEKKAITVKAKPLELHKAEFRQRHWEMEEYLRQFIDAHPDLYGTKKQREEMDAKEKAGKKEFYQDNPTAIEMNLDPHHHGFCETVLTAYNDHLGLKLRPDDLWNAVIQGFGQHINKFPEHFRSLIVPHTKQGDAKIQVTVDIHSDDPATVIHSLHQATLQAIAPKSREILGFAPDFTTTDLYSHAASTGVTLYACKPFIQYGVILSCGFSEFCLEGTIQDWYRLKERVLQVFAYLRQKSPESPESSESLESLESSESQPFHQDPQAILEHWQIRLTHVLDTFITMRQTRHWTRELDDFLGKILVKRHWGSSIGDSLTTIDGWLAAVLPFDHQGYYQRDSMNVTHMPSGLVTFHVQNRNTGQDLKVSTGFLGYQVAEDGYVSTVLGCRIQA